MYSLYDYEQIWSCRRHNVDIQLPKTLVKQQAIDPHLNLWILSNTNQAYPQTFVLYILKSLFPFLIPNLYCFP